MYVCMMCDIFRTCSQWYCSSLSLYSVVRSACVTPSMESMIGQAKS